MLFFFLSCSLNPDPFYLLVINFLSFLSVCRQFVLYFFPFVSSHLYSGSRLFSPSQPRLYSSPFFHIPTFKYSPHQSIFPILDTCPNHILSRVLSSSLFVRSAFFIFFPIYSDVNFPTVLSNVTPL